ncbi:MAG: hypothetical protein M3680_24820 [Myxococcota bacterium]|nr:hypothetical protein [Myxococcota bacterium]
MSDRALVISILLALSAGTAAAQTPTPADAAFKRGRELLKAGKPADACVEFEHSNKLDPQLGTAFNIAQCSEQTGKLARALELYRELLKRDTKPERKTLVAGAIPKLEARVPKLVVRTTSRTPGLVVTSQPSQGLVAPRTIDVNKPIEMDLGEYTIVARAPSRKDWTANIRIGEEAKTTTLEIPGESAGKPGDSADTATDPTATPPTTAVTPGVTRPLATDDDDDDGGEGRTAEPRTSKRKLFAIASLSVGGVALIGSAVLGASAKSTWTEAKAVCGGTTCATPGDLDRANQLGDDAASSARLSTIAVVVGGLAVAGGIVLWVTAPSAHEVRVSAAPARDGGGVTVSGRF